MKEHVLQDGATVQPCLAARSKRSEACRVLTYNAPQASPRAATYGYLKFDPFEVEGDGGIASESVS